MFKLDWSSLEFSFAFVLLNHFLTLFWPSVTHDWRSSGWRSVLSLLRFNSGYLLSWVIHGRAQPSTTIFSEPRSVNGEPNFIWPTVIEADVIFRGWLAVAAAVKAFTAPHSNSLSLSRSLAVGQWQYQSWHINRALGWKTAVTFLSATCNLTTNPKETPPRDDTCDKGPPSLNGWIFLTCFDSQWPKDSQRTVRLIWHFYESKNNLKNRQSSYESTDAGFWGPHL